MKEQILVFNAGSSSLKFCVFGRQDPQSWRMDARGLVDGASSRLVVRDEGGAILVDEPLGAVSGDSVGAFAVAADWIRDRCGDARVIGVGHRVVHGGADHSGPCLVTPDVVEGLRALVPLAPLHQPLNLAAIEAAGKRYPDVPQVACFDTSFHRRRAAVAELVPLPKAVREGGVQRYGFHGLSCEYIASSLSGVAPEIAGGRVLVAHLGSGASLCALRNGRSVESTLGFTALDGLCMGTRPGSLDPGVVLYLFRTLGMSAAEVETMLYEQSGLLGISGISNDMRDLVDNPDPAARLAVDYFVYEAAKHVGALAATLGGLDALVFTAGIGEHSAEIRRRLCRASAWLGLELDEEANERGSGAARRISMPQSRVAAWVIPTNEELMIARQLAALLGIPGRFA